MSSLCMCAVLEPASWLEGASYLKIPRLVRSFAAFSHTGFLVTPRTCRRPGKFVALFGLQGQPTTDHLEWWKAAGSGCNTFSFSYLARRLGDVSGYQRATDDAACNDETCA